MSMTTEHGQNRIDCSETDERYTVTVAPSGYIQCPGCDREYRVS